MDGDACFTLDGASAQDRAILMCIQRIEALEEKLDNIAKNNLINAIATCASNTNIALDVFFYLLGIPIELRKSVSAPDDIVKYHLAMYMTPERIASADPRITRLCDMLRSPKKFTDISSDDVEDSGFGYHILDNNIIKGSNMYSYLLTWTFHELQEYWNHRLQWTRWIDTQ
jgi:hypothetical protein